MAYEANESERWKKTESDQLDETAGAQTGEEETQWMNMKRGSKKNKKKQKKLGTSLLLRRAFAAH